MKKTLSLLLIALMLLTSVPLAFAADGISELKINPYGGAETDSDTVRWYGSGGEYYLFLPADALIEDSTVYFTSSDTVTLDGEPIESGSSASRFTAGRHTLSSGGISYSLTVLGSASIPSVYITTESGSLDYLHQNKNNKEPGTIKIRDDGDIKLDSALKQIKGRGNSTWTAYPKKPYNIKFDSKTSVLGMPKAKKWTLLANYFDYSLLHTPNSYFFADAFGLPYTSEYRHVDLYINNNYMGNYFICESVEIADNRIEIKDLEKANEKANPDIDIEALPIIGTGADGAVLSGKSKGSRKWADIPNDPADISGGYLLEYEYSGRYDEEPCGFVTENGQPVVIKSPEYASRNEVNYIADLVGAATEALYSPSGYNASGRHFNEYFDYESLINMYILQELGMNYDAALSSFYVFKPDGEEKLYVAPVWDMDNAFGSRSGKYGITLTDTSVWWANIMGYHNIPTMLTAAYSHSDFRSDVADRWADLRATTIFSSAYSYLSALRDELKASATMNAIRWNHFGNVSAETAVEKWEENANVSLNFVLSRASVLDRGYGVNRAFLFYDKNGAFSDNWGFASKIAVKGDTATIKAITGSGTINAPTGKQFYAWNTMPDGSGTYYKPGDSLTLTDEYAVLYAIWLTQEEIDALNAPTIPTPNENAENDDPGASKKSFKDMIVDFFNRLLNFFRRIFRIGK